MFANNAKINSLPFREKFEKKGIEPSKAVHSALPSFKKFNRFKSSRRPGMVADVYQRNLKIMSNIFRLSDDPGDRILVIYGNGHSPFFKSILLGSDKFEWVDAYDYLTK